MNEVIISAKGHHCGCYQLDRIRFIKAIISCESIVFAIIRNKNKISLLNPTFTVNIFTDRTLNQKVSMKKLR